MAEPDAERPAAILIVDDEPSVRESLAEWFRRDGYRTGMAANAREALEQLEASSWDVVLLDIKMPGMDGLELERRILATDPNMVVIMITAYASVESAVEALKQGAFDYITKPIDPAELTRQVQKGVERRRLARENEQLRQTIDEIAQVGPIIGSSPGIRRVMEIVRSVAPTDSTVLILGESGTGKELVAQAIHAASRRRYFPIVPVNCGALPETLLESELFGHEKGAFTGAQYRRKGRLEMADGGTLFLDEIGSVSLKMQVDLLRVLESKEFTRLGGDRPIRVDFRVICASNQNLEEKVEAGTFREDLYYRIHVVTLEIPPLRERREDIPDLARHLLRRYGQQMNRPFAEIEAEAMKHLSAHDWPGNVRELGNAIERALVLGTPPVLRARDLPPLGNRSPRAVGVSGVSGVSGISGGSGGSGVDQPLSEVERQHIERALAHCDWNISRAAAGLGIDRGTLYNKIKRYGLRQ